MSLRLRLALAYTAVIAVGVAIFGIVIQVAYERQAVMEIDRSLVQQVQQTRQALSAIRFPSLPPGADAVPRPPQPGDRRFEPGPVDEDGNPVIRRDPRTPPVVVPFRGIPFSNRILYTQTLDASGNIVTESDSLGGNTIPLTQEMVTALTSGESSVQSVTTSGGTPLRVYTTPLSVPGTPIATLQVARSLESVENALAILRTIVLAGTVTICLSAGIISWLVARSSLRPLETMARTAESIQDTRDLHQRIPYAGPRDEVGRLASTMNTMLARLEQATGTVQRALDAQRQFTADASHELRTPVTSIRVNADTLLKNPAMDPADRDEAIADIAGEAERMSSMINQLLLLARADSGLQPPHQPLDLVTVVNQAARKLRPLLGSRSLVTRLEVPEAPATGSEELLQQLLLILGDNAIRYGKPDGRIEFALRGEPGAWVLSVTDDGPGFGEEDPDRLFERFHRGPNATGDGSGLGLAIARWIAREHGGSITAFSDQGQGAVFVVRIPVREDAAEAPGEGPETAG